MPSRKSTPRPAPRQCSPSAMHTPSPASRTGTSGTAAATRSRSGKLAPGGDIDRADGARGQRRWGPRSRYRPRGSRRRRPWPRRRSSARPRSKHVLLSWPFGVGSTAVCTSSPAWSTSPTAILVPPMSRAGSASAFSAGGCCRVDVGRRDARIRVPAAPVRPGAGRATPGTPVAARRPAGVRRSIGRTCVSGGAVDGRGAPAVAVRLTTRRTATGFDRGRRRCRRR